MAIILTPEQRLSHIRKEWHARKRAGKNVCFITLDSSMEWIIIGQKLPQISAFINSHVVGNEPCFSVSHVGLYEVIDSCKGRHGGFHKNRWRVISCELDRAGEMYASLRKQFKNAAIVGNEACYTTKD